jgi:tetratricopeptide (TPR) repeat protein
MEPAGRLNSWKEIAAYLGVTARTAQRWEKIESLPARRHKHEVLSSVFAYPSELDAWWHSRPNLRSLSRGAGTSARSIAVLPFLWSERFDHRMTDLFDLQEEIARAIVNAIQMKLGAARITRQNGQDPGIYEMYLEGRYHCNRRTGSGFFRAVECFEQVLAKDGRMAQAWAGLADCHAFLGPLAGIPFEEAMPRAKAAALKALAIDDSLPDAHCSLGFVLAVFEYDWNCSEAHFRRALQLQPDHANSHVWYGGHVLAPLARLDEAAIHARRACELDPLSPPAMSGLAGSWLMSRRPDEAVSAGKATLDLDPVYPIALRFLGEAYLLKNMVGEAAGAFSKIQAPVIAAGFLGYCHARSGCKDKARQILRELEGTDSPSPALQIAAVHLGLDDRDSAFNWLQRACAERSMGVHWLKVEPIWDPLRPDRRFTALLRELHLTAD